MRPPPVREIISSQVAGRRFKVIASPVIAPPGSWKVEFNDGVYLPEIDWWLDAHTPVNRSFVSHAHFDHLATHREILCSSGTARLMRARLPGERIEHVLPFGQTEPLTDDCAVTLHPAGHIFGSAQCLLEHPTRGSLLYTGDFKLRPGLSAERCATPAADTLIMETTYGRPQYEFPPTEEVLQSIVRFCHQTLEDGETPVLFGYSLGKSQELLSALAASALPAMLHPQTVRMTQVYQELGVEFPAYRVFTPDELPGHVVICPPQSPQSAFLRKIPHPRTAMITGWALDPGAAFRYQCNTAFPLSDHADFCDLIRFVERVKPRRVLTLHGFAADFARTLRERGVEAWAIGQDNQLEFSILPSAELPAVTAPVASPDSTEANSFHRFVATAEALKATTKKGEKVDLLKRYLSSLDDASAGLAALFFTGRPFPQSDGRTLNLGWSLIRRAILDHTGLTPADFRKTYQRFSDSGEAAEALLVQRTQPRDWSLAEQSEFFARLASSRGALAKLELFRARLAELSPGSAKYLIKILTGDLRIGLKEGLVEEAIANSAGASLEVVREANMLSGDLSAVMIAARGGRLADISLRVFHPLQFMLASPEPTAEAIMERLAPPVWLEDKYDGIRCQVHKSGARVEIFSRDLHRITEQFPELVASIRQLTPDFIIDGELLAWSGGRALPFAELQKRLGRVGGDDFFLGAEIPISVSCFDLLWLDGQSLLKIPLLRRRASLETLLAPGNPVLRLAPRGSAHTAREIDAAFLSAKRHGNEGLVIKDPESIYTPGRRGLAWLKLKKAGATLDVVVVGAEYGHGKRRDVLSDYTFAVRDDETDRLLVVGKAYSGLTDVEISELTHHFLEHTVQIHGRYRSVVPNVVLEVAFDSIRPSQRHSSGYALRFPRIARIRTDKTIADIDKLATCRLLSDGQSNASTDS